MADQEDQSSKTEEPSAHKLQKLREDGNIPTSKEVNNLFMLAGFLVFVAFFTPALLVTLRDLFGANLQNIAQQRGFSYDDLAPVLYQNTVDTLWALAPMFGIFMFLAIAGSFLQAGPIFTFKPIEPRLEKISPIKGFERLFSLKSLVEFLKSVVKLVVIGTVIYFVFVAYQDSFLILPDKGVYEILEVTHTLAIYIIMAALAVMVLLAIVDYLFEQAQYIQKNRMSLKELKDEFKETQGDPYVKSRQRQIRQQRARERMMQAIPQADVIITNPTHYSVALKYKPEENMAAPVVVAKGVDFMAMRIREIADQYQIPRYEDAPLARQLYKDVELEQEIPLALYEVTAKVIAFVLDLKRRRQRS